MLYNVGISECVVNDYTVTHRDEDNISTVFVDDDIRISDAAIESPIQNVVSKLIQLLKGGNWDPPFSGTDPDRALRTISNPFLPFHMFQKFPFY